jgi:hypothetical protein
MSRDSIGHRARLGFRDGEKGVHSSRSLMVADLRTLFDAVPPDGGLSAYRAAVVDENVLGKRSETTRKHTLRKLKALYGLDPSIPVFRVFRRLWEEDSDARPLLALMCAVGRDPLLRSSVDTVLDMALGEEAQVNRIEEGVGTRFSASTLRSIGVRILSSWTQAGFLQSTTNRLRVQAPATPGAAAYALALGFMEGGKGSLLLSTLWARLLDRSTDDVLVLVQQAARRGWVVYRAAGDVMDLRVEGLFTDEERGWCDGQ